jgi:mono/diheme cytochrome c family protein
MEGVQCEACHGPGSLYKSPKIMSRSKFKKDPQGQRKLAMEAGLVLGSEEVCLKCHGQKRPEGHPPAKPFNFQEAFKKIDHKKK